MLEKNGIRDFGVEAIKALMAGKIKSESNDKFLGMLAQAIGSAKKQVVVSGYDLVTPEIVRSLIDKGCDVVFVTSSSRPPNTADLKIEALNARPWLTTLNLPSFIIVDENSLLFPGASNGKFAYVESQTPSRLISLIKEYIFSN